MKAKADYMEIVRQFQKEQRQLKKMSPEQQLTVLDAVLRSWRVPQISAKEAEIRFNQS